MSDPKEEKNDSAHLNSDSNEFLEMCSPEKMIKISPDGTVNGSTTDCPSPDLFSINGDSPKRSPQMDLDIDGTLEIPPSQNRIRISENTINGTSTHIPSSKVFSMDLDIDEILEIEPSQNRVRISENTVNGTTTNIPSSQVFSINEDSYKVSPSVDLDNDLEIQPSQNKFRISENVYNGTTTPIPSPEVFSLNEESLKCSPLVDLDINGILDIPASQYKIQISKKTDNEVTIHIPSPENYSVNGESSKFNPPMSLDIDGIVEISPSQNKNKLSSESTINGTATYTPSSEVLLINEDSPKCISPLEEDITEDKNTKTTPEDTINGFSIHVPSPDHFSIHGDSPKNSPPLDGEDTELEELKFPEKKMKMTPDETVNGATTFTSSPDLFSVHGDTPKCSPSVDQEIKIVPDDIVNGSCVSSCNQDVPNEDTMQMKTALSDVDINMSDYIVFGKRDNSAVVADPLNAALDELSQLSDDNEDKSTAAYWIKKKMPFAELFAEEYNRISKLTGTDADFENLTPPTEYIRPQENVENHTNSDMDDYSEERISQIVFDDSNWQEYDTIVHNGKIVSKSLFANGKLPTDDSDTEEFKEYTLDELGDFEVKFETEQNGEDALEIDGEQNITPINEEMQTAIDESKMNKISEYTLDELNDVEVKSEIIQNGTDLDEGHYIQMNGDIQTVTGETKVKIFNECTLDELDDVEVKAEIIQNGIKSLQLNGDETRTEFDQTQVMKLNGNFSEEVGEEIEVIVIDPDISASEESQSQTNGEEKDAQYSQIKVYNETSEENYKLYQFNEDANTEMDAKASQKTLKYEDEMLPLLTEVDQSVLNEADILMFEEYFAQLNAGEIQTVIDDPEIIDSYENNFFETVPENQNVDENTTIISEETMSQEIQEDKQTTFDEVKTEDNILDGINLEENITYLNEADVLTLEEYMLQASAEEAQMFLDETQMIMCQEITVPPTEEVEQTVIDNSQIPAVQEEHQKAIKKVSKRKSKNKKTKPRIRITPLRKVVKSFMRKKIRKQRPDPDYSTWYMENDNPANKKLEEYKGGRRRKQKNPRFINDLPEVLRRLSMDPVPRAPPKMSPKKSLEVCTQVNRPVHPYKIRRKRRYCRINRDRPANIVGESSSAANKKSIQSKEKTVTDGNSTEAPNQSIISISSTEEDPQPTDLIVHSPQPSVSYIEEDLRLIGLGEDHLPLPASEDEDELPMETDFLEDDFDKPMEDLTTEEEKLLEDSLIAGDDEKLEYDLTAEEEEKLLEDDLPVEDEDKPLEKEFITDEEFVEYAVSVIDYLYEQQYVSEE